MRHIRMILVFGALFSFLACQGPYNKPKKKPIKIGLRAKVLAQKAAEKKAAAPKEKDIEETKTLDDKGVGPVKSVEVGEDIDQDMAKAGSDTFNTLCVACHRLDKRFVGPPLGDVTSFRSPEWIMNMILNPQNMLDNDPVAKKLLKKYGSPMVNLGLKKEEARELLEYLRSVNKD